ncbi:MAG: ABC transporter substrate-binding protein, partial [Propionibacterium sp.]|nr:ABC transporter substrate-binding protein [Propionibacterium sp.]
ARDDYWRGEVNIKTIRATYLGDPAAITDTFKADGMQMAMIRNPQYVDEFLGAEQPGFLNMVPMGNVAIINTGEGRAGADVRVRKALQLAIDPQVVVDRVYGGSGYASSELFPEISSWHSGVEALGYDPEEAKKLVEEAKADGFDGKITYTQLSTPDSREQAMALKAMWDAAGFETELDILRNPQELGPRVFIERDYEVSTWGLSWREAEPWARAAATMHSSGNTLGMATSPEMDALIEELQGAETKDESKEILGRIQELWNEEVPAIMLGPAPDFVMWAPELRGVKSHINAMVVLDEAWIEQG